MCGVWEMFFLRFLRPTFVISVILQSAFIRLVNVTYLIDIHHIHKCTNDTVASIFSNAFIIPIMLCLFLTDIVLILECIINSVIVTLKAKA